MDSLPSLVRSRPQLSLALAVVAVSFAAIFIRMSSAPPLIISFYRTLFASLILAPFILSNRNYRAQLKELKGKKFFYVMGAGLALSLHFFTWITSLNYTSVASSVVLVSTQPVFLLLLELIFLGDRPARSLIAGVGLTMAGTVLIGFGDFGGGGSSFVLRGDLLALTGGLMAACYFLIGSKVRQRMDTLPYVFSVYSITASLLLIFCLASGVELLTYSARNYYLFVLLALVPTLIGHNLFNWALREVKASRVGTTILGEPVGSSLLAALFFEEYPPLLSIVGGLFVLSGIYYVWRKRKGDR